MASDITRTAMLDDGDTLLTLYRYHLHVTDSTGETTTHSFDGRVCTVGTHPDNHLCLDDPEVSRQHCQIEVEADGYRLRDLNSKNGCYLGALRLGEIYLENGTTWRIGRHEIRFEPTDETVDIRLSRKSHFSGLIGGSTAMREVFGVLERVAPTEATVLIEGESGTGKELAARAIHERSKRKDGPFVVFDCSAVAKDLLESELFGHVKGAFTGAVASRDGLFAAASGGTLFLDEIGDMPIEVQVALLRVLETGEVRPVGGHRARAVDVRLVAATDAKLQERVSAGTFRLALLQRISGYQIHMPPLRERRDDVGRLLARFLHEELERQGHLDRLHPQDRGAKPWLPAVIVGRLLRYRWPGNVRELRNVVRQIVITNRSTQTFELDPAVEALFLTEPSAPSAPVVAEVDAPAAQRRPADITDAQLVSTLRENDYRYESTARALGIARNSLMALIEKSPSVRRPRDIAPHEITATLAACDGDTTRAAAALGVPRRGLQRRITELGL